MSKKSRHVYVMQHSKGVVKVGISLSMDARILAISTWKKPITIAWMTPLRSDALDVEMIAHTILGDSHITGEWFCATVAQAVEAISTAIAMSDAGDLSKRKRVAFQKGDVLSGTSVMNIRFMPEERAALDLAAKDARKPPSTMAKWILRQRLGI